MSERTVPEGTRFEEHEGVVVIEQERLVFEQPNGALFCIRIPKSAPVGAVAGALIHGLAERHILLKLTDGRYVRPTGKTNTGVALSVMARDDETTVVF